MSIYEQYADKINDEYQKLVQEGARRDLSPSERMEIRRQLTILRRQQKRWRAILAAM